MTINVNFEHNWNTQDLEKWKVDNEGEQFDDYDRNDLLEISLFADLTKRYPDMSLSVLETVAKGAIEEAIELGFNDIVERWMGYRAYDEIQKTGKMKGAHAETKRGEKK